MRQVRGDEEDLPSAPDMKQRSGSPERRRSPAGGCRAARPGCGSGLGCRPPGTSRLWDETMQRGSVVGGGVEVQGNFQKIKIKTALLHPTARAHFEVSGEEPRFRHV